MKTKSVLVKVGKRHARRAGHYTESQGCLLSCALRDAVPNFFSVGPRSVVALVPGARADRLTSVPLPRGVDERVHQWYLNGANPEKFRAFSFTLEIPQP